MTDDICVKAQTISSASALVPLHRMKKFYMEAAAASNITILDHPVTFDPEASWLQFHLGINRYALYSRDDSSVDRLLRDMQTATVISAGDAIRCQKTCFHPAVRFSTVLYFHCQKCCSCVLCLFTSECPNTKNISVYFRILYFHTQTHTVGVRIRVYRPESYCTVMYRIA